MDSQVRFLKEMKSVLYDQKWAKNADPNFELYRVSRKIKIDGDLRYDITEMPAQMLGKEFARTKGNYNSKGYWELYTVLKGKAIFLIQKQKDKIIDDVAAIKASEGDWIMVPPHYSVITINPSLKETLKTGNWVSEKTQNIYQDIERMKGASYFYTKDGWIKNENYTSKYIRSDYKNVPDLRFEKPLKKRPKSLDFLRKENL